MSDRFTLSERGRELLLGWFYSHKRDLPWRRTGDPYAILVSEVMLQQTQVATVIPYFERWMERFPTFESLAVATESEILNLWQGLGYYRRARLLQKAAQYVLEKGTPAPKAADWVDVPGIGRYTAGAVTSIAFGSAEPLVDGNVMRVYSRLAANPSVKELEKHAWEWAEREVHESSPGDWNQALMELGATICTPKNPKCPACPLASECQALAHHNPVDFPSPKPKPQIILLQETTIVPRWKGKFGVVQIPKGKWWEGMWQFPRFEMEDKDMAVAEFGPTTTYLGTVKHTVTKHRIQLAVYSVRYDEPDGDHRWETLEGLSSLPMPAPQLRALELASKNGTLFDM